jgi:uridine kinase
LLVAHLKELRTEQYSNPFILLSLITEQKTPLPPRKVMIVEGILILANPELRDLFDVKIYVHADSDEADSPYEKRYRRPGRNMDEVLNRYQNTLKPMHQQFIEPTKAFADIIIPNDRHNTVAIDVVRAVINQRIL